MKTVTKLETGVQVHNLLETSDRNLKVCALYFAPIIECCTINCNVCINMTNPSYESIMHVFIVQACDLFMYVEVCRYLHRDEPDATNMKFVKFLFSVLNFQKAHTEKKSEDFFLTQRGQHRYTMNVESIKLLSLCVSLCSMKVPGSFFCIFSNLLLLCQVYLLRY